MIEIPISCDIRKKIDTYVTERNMIKQRLAEAEAALLVARTRQVDIDVVQNTIQYVAARVQTNFGNHVGGLVTKAMHHVFPDKHKEFFVVRFRPNNGKTECQLRIRPEVGDEAHPYACSGGGVWDTLSFALQCACLVLEQPATTRFIVVDEPFKNLHGAMLRKRAVQMLYNTCKLLNIQCIAVHQADDASDPGSGLEVLENKPDCAVYLVKLIAYETSEVVNERSMA